MASSSRAIGVRGLQLERLPRSVNVGTRQHVRN